MAPKIHMLQEKERLQPDFWEDYKWALEHYGELREKYADMWVAIADKKVVAFGEDLTDEKEESIRKEIDRPPVTLFVEGLARIL
jgi:hypothetical protein